MGRVDAFAIGGLDLWFNSHDHGPPHFHVRRPGEWEIRVYFLDCTEEVLVFDQKWGREPRNANIKLLRQQVNREADAKDHGALPSTPPLQLVVNNDGHTNQQAMCCGQAIVDPTGDSDEELLKTGSKAA